MASIEGCLVSKVVSGRWPGGHRAAEVRSRNTGARIQEQVRIINLDHTRAPVLVN
jgi:hypothetical protein